MGLAKQSRRARSDESHLLPLLLLLDCLFPPITPLHLAIEFTQRHSRCSSLQPKAASAAGNGP